MKQHMKQMTVWLLMAVLMLVCVPMQDAHAIESMKVYANMDSFTAGEELEILFGTNLPGVDHFDCTVLNQTTGKYPRPRSATNSYYCCYISGSLMTAGSYKVWVGAVAADGTLVAEGLKYFTVNAKEECDHRWSSKTGCCTRCDKECSHSNVMPVNRNQTWRSYSSTKHKVYETYDEACSVCGYIVREDLEASVQTVSHSFDSNGDCKLCEYRAACKHKNTELVPHDPTYTQYDATYHKKKVISDLYCANANCGKRLENNADLTETKEKHTMSGDRCTKCGYTVQYEPVTVTVWRNAASAKVGELITAGCTASGGTGKYEYYWYVYCNGASVYSTGSWDTSASYTATKAGSYTFKVTVKDRNNGDSASASTSGITVSEVVCQHPGTKDVKDGSPTYSKLSNSKHTVRTDWARVCTSCNKTISTWYSTDEEAHTYSGGNCTRCGAAEEKEACTHPGKKSTEISRSWRASNSDKQHYVDILWEDRCSACNIVLDRTRKTTVSEAHAFSNDTCTRCGYTKVKECDHASEDRQAQSSTTKQYDSQFHVVTTTYRIVCKDCGKLLKAEHKESKYVNHTPSGNTCTACGYRVKCSHPASDKEFQGMEFKSVDSNQHVVITTYRKICTTCKAVVADNYREEAYFEHTMVDGRCKHCGYTQKPCSHTETEKVHKNTLYESANDKQHVVTTVYNLICKSCQKIVDTDYREFANFDHSIVKGRCVHCGYTPDQCSHEKYDKELLDTIYEPAGDQEHAVTTVYRLVCKSCRKVLDDDHREHAFFDHTMVDGVCRLCAYRERQEEAACGHPDTYEVYQNTTYDAVDDDRHRRTEHYMLFCTSCGDLVSEDFCREETEAHSMTDGRCSSCGYEEKKAVVCPVYGDAHKYSYTGYESDHETERDYPGSHNIFRRCACGYADYTGETKTNLPKEICCYCGNHQYGESYVSGDLILRKCVNCSATLKLGEVPPECSENGKHDFSKRTYAAKHPHQLISAECSCGAKAETLDNEFGWSVECCECGFHEWYIYRVDGMMGSMGCPRCGAQQVAKITSEQKMADVFIGYEHLTHGNDPFSNIGGAAIEKLRDKGFVMTSEALNATSEIGSTLVNAAVDAYAGKPTYNEQVVSNWEHLIMQMLIRNPKYGYSGEAETLLKESAAYKAYEGVNAVHGQYKFITDDDYGFAFNMKDWSKLYDSVIGDIDKQIDGLKEAVENNTASPAQKLRFEELTESRSSMETTRQKLKSASKGEKAFGTAMEVASFAMEGLAAWDQTAQLQEDYMALAVYYNANVEKLDSLIAAAEKVNAHSVVEAAKNVRQTLDQQISTTAEALEAQYLGEKALNTEVAVGKKVAGELVGDALETLAPPLKWIGGAGKAADWYMNYGAAYESAQKMMLLRNMDNELGSCVEDAVQLDGAEAYYFTELFGVLQIEGLYQTKEFLKDYEKGRDLSVSEFGVTDLNAYLDKIDDRIDKRVSQNEYMYVLYGQSMQEKAAEENRNKNAKMCQVIAVSATLRAGAGTKYERLGSAAQDQQFEILETATDANGTVWYKVSGGWISSSMVEIIK